MEDKEKTAQKPKENGSSSHSNTSSVIKYLVIGGIVIAGGYLFFKAMKGMQAQSLPPVYQPPDVIVNVPAANAPKTFPGSPVSKQKAAIKKEKPKPVDGII